MATAGPEGGLIRTTEEGEHMHFVRDTDDDLVNLDVVATLRERTTRGGWIACDLQGEQVGGTISDDTIEESVQAEVGVLVPNTTQLRAALFDAEGGVEYATILAWRVTSGPSGSWSGVELGGFGTPVLLDDICDEMTMAIHDEKTGRFIWPFSGDCPDVESAKAYAKEELATRRKIQKAAQAKALETTP